MYLYHISITIQGQLYLTLSCQFVICIIRCRKCHLRKDTLATFSFVLCYNSIIFAGFKYYQYPKL